MSGTSSTAFTLTWYVVVLAAVFTLAFWVGRLVGPEPEPFDDHNPVTPHSPGVHP